MAGETDGVDGLSAWRAWREWLRVANSGSPDTVRGYTQSVLRFLAEVDVRDVADYREADCLAFLQTFAPRGAAKHQYAKSLRSYFEWCQRRGFTDANPMGDIRLRKPRRRPAVALTSDELVRLLTASVFVHGQRTAWCVLLIYVLGLRRIEAAGLKWEHIRQGASGPVIEIRVSKGGFERDPLPLTPLALECLARIHELPAPRARLGSEYVVRATRGTISDWVHAAGVAAELPARKIGAHRLRASLATDLLKAGVDVRVVSQVLGHLRLESTAWYLESADEGEVRAGMERLAVAV